MRLTDTVEVIRVEEENVLGSIEDKKISWILLQVPDIIGRVKQIAVNSKEFTRETFTRGFGATKKLVFPSEDEQEEIVIIPDPATYAIIPWANGIARMLCNLKERKNLDIRETTKKTTEALTASEDIANVYVGSSIDFYIFDSMILTDTQRGAGHNIESIEAPWNSTGQNYPIINSKNAMYSPTPIDRSEGIRYQIAETLETMFNYRIEKHYHGDSFGLNTLVCSYGIPTASADVILSLRYVGKNIGALSGRMITFVPKPAKQCRGATLRITVSLFDGDTNLFEEKHEVLQYFASGVIEHIESIMAFTNPTTNSYKRIRAEEVKNGVGTRNKSYAINIPHAEKSFEHRIEFNFPDPSSNPYLAISALLLAGYDGVKKKKNLLSTSPKKGHTEKLFVLPTTLNAAIEALLSDNLYLKHAISKELIEAYCTEKLEEIKNSNNAITSNELIEHFDI